MQKHLICLEDKIAFAISVNFIYNKKYMKRGHNFNDLTNQQVGFLTALSFNRRNDKTYWLCRCICGNTKEIWQGSLGGHTKSCGCLKNRTGTNNPKFEDLTGKKFGKWMVIKLSNNRKNDHCVYVCKCDCGTIKEVLGVTLTNKTSTTCGCPRTYVGKAHPKFKGHEDISGTFMNELKYNAKARKLLVSPEITAQFIWELLVQQNKICAGTGEILDEENWSVDRIDTSLGYIPGNLQMVHKSYNKFKWSYSTEVVEYIVKKVVEFNGVFIPRKLDLNSRFDSRNYSGSIYFDGTKIGRIIGTCKKRKRDRKKQVDYFLTNDDLDLLWEKQQGRCGYTGLPLNNESIKDKTIKASLDRIDSNGHYTMNNVEWVDARINNMKNDLSKYKFLEICRIIYAYRKLGRAA